MNIPGEGSILGSSATVEGADQKVSKDFLAGGSEFTR